MPPLQRWLRCLMRRAVAQASEPTRQADFHTVVRGGAWAQAHKGTAADCIIGKVKSGPANTWRAAYGVQKVASFACSKYGEHAATQLALEW